MQTLCECDLSVIVPVYNLEKWITPILKSFKEQKTHYNVEYLFVMNNCTDRSEEIVKEYGYDILHCDIQGCGPARNKGFKESTGRYIWFIDGDDWLLSETTIEDCMNKMIYENLDILRIPFISNQYHMNYFSMVWQYLFRRGFIEDIKFQEIQPHEDDAFMAEVLKRKGLHAGNFMNLPAMDKPLYYYNYLREGSNMYRHYRGEKL